MSEKEFPAETLNDLLTYDPESGHLFWKPRPAHLFSSSERRTAEQNAKWWNGRFAGKPACRANGWRGYRRVGFKGIYFSAHRVIWAMHHGSWPEDLIDHADGDNSNNRIENLRSATLFENNRNRASHGASRYRGVSYRTSQSCWIASIGSRDESTFLGCFETEIEAAQAYDRAAIESYGEFARLNFPKRIGGE